MGRYFGGHYVPDPGEAPGTPVSQNPNQGTHTNFANGKAGPGGAATGYYTGNQSYPSYQGAGTLNPAQTGGYGGSPTTKYTPPPADHSTGTDFANLPPLPGAGGKAAAPWVPYSAPGVSEQFYDDHKGFWDQPGQGSQYWNGVKGFFGAEPSQAEGDLGRWGQQLGNTPSYSETRYADNSRNGVYDQPGAAESFWSQYGNQFMQPSKGEDAIGASLDALKAPGDAENYYAQHGQDFAAPGALENLFPQLRNDLSRYGQTELLAQGYKPETSFAENFLTGGGAGEGLDAMYDRLYQQGSRKLGDEGAARGGYNSGASLRAAEELHSDLTGRHVQDLQAATNAADAAKIARQRYGLDVMKGADETMLGREQGLLAAGTGAQKAMTERVLGGGTLAKQSEEGFLGRQHETTAAGEALGNLVRKRGEFGSEASTRAQTAQRDRVAAGMDASHMASGDLMDRIAKAGALEGQGQQLHNQRLATGGQLAEGAGVEDNTRMTGGQSAAHLAQGDKEARESGVIKNLMDVANSQAGTYANMTSQQRSEELQLKMTEIDGLLNKGKISATQAQQMRDMYTQMLGAPIAAAGGVAGRTPPKSSAYNDPDYQLPMR